MLTINYLFFLLGISKEVKKVLLLNLRRDFPLEVAPVLLAPLIYSDKPDHPMDKINSDTSTIPKIMVITVFFMIDTWDFYINIYLLVY